MINPTSNFSKEERATLHSLAEMFQDKESRDDLRNLVQSGATIRELVLAYKINHRVGRFLKASGSVVVLIGAVVATLRGMNIWPFR